MKSKLEIVDIRENSVDEDVLSVLLIDRTTNKNIIWATDDYSELGSGYGFFDKITVKKITGENDGVIKPRVEKSKEQQSARSKDKAEVFTPSWVCNAQNNLIDDAWFGKSRKRFNSEKENGWTVNYYPIKFEQSGKTWQDYVLSNRIEITCGEAPYLTSRYDAVTGKYIAPGTRIGLLDRKLRVISENIKTPTAWLNWAKKALQSTYGFEWQGDNIVLARENLLYTVVEFYFDKFGKEIKKEILLEFAEIISWNIWQMDGIKFVKPCSCTDQILETQNLFGTQITKISCPGCEKNNHHMHNGTYSTIMNWKENKVERFIESVKEEITYV